MVLGTLAYAMEELKGVMGSLNIMCSISSNLINLSVTSNAYTQIIGYRVFTNEVSCFPSDPDLTRWLQ